MLKIEVVSNSQFASVGCSPGFWPDCGIQGDSDIGGMEPASLEEEQCWFW